MVKGRVDQKIGSLYGRFVKLREFIRNLLGRIQGTRHLVHSLFVIPGSSLYRRFVTSGFHCMFLNLDVPEKNLWSIGHTCSQRSL